MMLPTLRTLGPDFVHPNSIPERPPIPSIHVKAVPLSLSPPIERRSTGLNLFYRSDDKNEFVRDLKSDSFARRSCPDINPVKISQSQENEQRRRRREQIETSSRKQSDAKAIRLKANIENRFLKTESTQKDN
jgi:hypothetical protein